MKTKKTAVALGVTLLWSLAISTVAANADTLFAEELPKDQKIVSEYIDLSDGSVQDTVVFSIPSTDEIEDYAACVTAAGFETTVSEGNGIMGSTADAKKPGYDAAHIECEKVFESGSEE